MSRKIARITQEKKLLLANEVVEDNTKIRLDNDGRLDTDEIIEYPAELEGGRNLLRNASALNGNPFVRYGVDYNLVNSPTYINETRTAHIVNNKGLNDGSQMNSGIRINPTNLIPGEVYTFSFYGNDDWEKFHPISYFSYDASINNSQSVVINSDWTRYSVKFIPQSSNIWFFIRPNRNQEYDFDVYLNAPKIEKGSQVTPWTPAPEDLGLNYPDSIQNFNSSINGNNIIVPEFIEGYPLVKPVIDDSLVLWLDGSTGNNYEQTGIWKDLSGNGNHGQLMNFGYTENSGWVDGGLKFDGVDDYALINDNIFDLDLFTVELHFIRHNYMPTYTPLVMSNSNFPFSIYFNSNRIAVDLGNNIKSKSFVTQKTIENNINYNLFVVVNRIQNLVTVILDGEILDVVASDGIIANSSLVTLMSREGKSNFYCNASLNIFRIYNRALTDKEILQNYQAGQCSPLLAMRGDIDG